jgi:hypothetical protein
MSQAGSVSVSSGGGGGGNLTFSTQSGSATSSGGIINFTATGGTFSGSGSTVSLNITATGVMWSDHAVSFLASSNTGSFCTAALTMTMPTSPLNGDIIFMISNTSGVITMQANTGQSFRVGQALSAVAGTCSSSKIGDAIEFVYRSTDLVWYCANSPQGTFSTV